MQALIDVPAIRIRAKRFESPDDELVEAHDGLVLLCVGWFSDIRQAAPAIPRQERTVILVSLDGFRWGYLQKYQPTNLVRLAKAGVRAKRLTLVFPTQTSPNHYTIVPGLYPEHHGIIRNNFYDPTFRTSYEASMRHRWNRAGGMASRFG